MQVLSNAQKVIKYGQLYTRLKRCVFRRDLKVASVGARLTSSGSLLNSVGAKHEKALAPYVFDL